MKILIIQPVTKFINYNLLYLQEIMTSVMDVYCYTL